MSFSALLAEDRRLAILRILEGDARYATNDSVMQTALDRIGHSVSREMVRSDFAWLAELGLVELEQVTATVHVARLTGRGVDVAAGRASVPGVKRPRPAG